MKGKNLSPRSPVYTDPNTWCVYYLEGGVIKGKDQISRVELIKVQPDKREHRVTAFSIKWENDKWVVLGGPMLSTEQGRKKPFSTGWEKVPEQIAWQKTLEAINDCRGLPHWLVV